VAVTQSLLIWKIWETFISNKEWPKKKCLVDLVLVKLEYIGIWKRVCVDTILVVSNLTSRGPTRRLDWSGALTWLTKICLMIQSSRICFLLMRSDSISIKYQRGTTCYPMKMNHIIFARTRTTFLGSCFFVLLLDLDLEMEYVCLMAK
jgi:hypothetical protein